MENLPPPTALERCQSQRDEIRAERDAALAEVARLRKEIDVAAWAPMTIADVNTLVAGDLWIPAGVNDVMVKVLKAALYEQQRRYAARVEAVLNASR